jgi:hypothetical protein
MAKKRNPCRARLLDAGQEVEMKSKKAVLALGILGFAGLMALATPARADFSLFVGRPGFSVFGGNPAPPPPVIYAEPRVYYAPPVYGYPRYYKHKHHKHHWKHWKKHHRHHHHHDD